MKKKYVYFFNQLSVMDKKKNFSCLHECPCISIYFILTKTTPATAWFLNPISTIRIRIFQWNLSICYHELDVSHHVLFMLILSLLHIFLLIYWFFGFYCITLVIFISHNGLWKVYASSVMTMIWPVLYALIYWFGI